MDRFSIPSYFRIDECLPFLMIGSLKSNKRIHVVDGISANSPVTENHRVVTGMSRKWCLVLERAGLPSNSLVCKIQLR